jgi:hypothetical protein
LEYRPRPGVAEDLERFFPGHKQLEGYQGTGSPADIEAVRFLRQLEAGHDLGNLEIVFCGPPGTAYTLALAFALSIKTGQMPRIASISDADDNHIQVVTSGQEVVDLLNVRIPGFQ